MFRSIKAAKHFLNNYDGNACPLADLSCRKFTIKQSNQDGIKFLVSKRYLICGFVLALFVALSLNRMAFAIFSAFVVITPANETEHPFLVQAQPLENKPGYTRVRVIGPVDGYQKTWLIECKQSLLPESQNFRMTIWGYKQFNDDIIKITPDKSKNGIIVHYMKSGRPQYVSIPDLHSIGIIQSAFKDKFEIISP